MGQKKESSIASFEMMKEALRKDSELEGFFARSFWFGIGAVLLPLELVKTGLEKVGVHFDEGDGNSNPYDL